ncbi:MAG: helix-turn-helix domain-containing protein [Lysobacterales bacterium]
MVETDTPLSRVADQVGYRSEAAFSQAFKKQYGLRPGEFRRAHASVAA